MRDAGSWGVPHAAMVIPVRNAENDLPDLLGSLAASTYQDWCVYFVDDASEDATGRILAAWCKEQGNGEVLTLPQRVGPPAARNAAIKKALANNHPLIVFHDSDCIIEAHTLNAHMTAHEIWPHAGIVGGPVKGIHHTRVGRADGYASWFTSPPGRPSGRVRFLHLPTCNMSVKSRVFETTGLFREELATGEDVAFCHAARRAGIEIKFAKEALCFHKDRDQWIEALAHHRRWGEHTHHVRAEKDAFLGSLVLRSSRACRLLAIPYAWAFTLLVIALWVRYDPRVILDIGLIYRMKRAFTQGMVTGAMNFRAR